MIILFSGDSGSTFGSISETRYLVASPRWPRYSPAHAMFSGSAVQVPCVRLTRRTFFAHAMMFSLRRHRGVGASGPLAHLVEAGPVGVDVGDRTGRAGRGACGIAAAQVALLHLAGLRNVVDRAERAGDRADLAADAGVVVDDLRAESAIDLDG